MFVFTVNTAGSILHNTYCMMLEKLVYFETHEGK